MNLSAEAGLPARFLFPALRPGVHVAFADNRLVILDVEGDRYLRIDRSRSRSFAESCRNPSATSVVAVLKAKGLTTSPQRLQPGVSSVASSVLGEPKLDAGKLPGVIAACMWAARIQRRVGFAGVLRAVRRPQKLRDAARLPGLVQDFLRWRPLYPKDYACMFEALALLRYLALRRHWANWVFGVRGAPFAAHCWLERDGVVLNDEPAAVAPYARIMAV